MIIAFEGYNNSISAVLRSVNRVYVGFYVYGFTYLHQNQKPLIEQGFLAILKETVVTVLIKIYWTTSGQNGPGSLLYSMQEQSH